MTPDTDRIVSRFGARSTALDVIEGIDLGGRHALVTGAAGGVGAETVRALAAAGAQVTLAVRRREQGEALAERLRAERPGVRLQVVTLDLADPAGVARFARDWLAAGPPLHLLVANAAIMACPFARTPQGWESQFATNHLGHFALVRGLLPALLAAAPARVVAVSSIGHKRSPIVFDDLHFERRPYDKWSAYGQSKTANALMAVGLHLRHAGDGLTANALHPGGIMTGLQQHLSLDEQRAMGWLDAEDRPLSIFKSVEQGAATSVWAATAPELEGRGGRYLEDCGEGLPATPGDRISGWAPHGRDPEAAQRLWDVSERLLDAV
jgi:NAD(P)-dependent dehydrogenase (short-subunit alcohol dehydrogenase family)